MLSVIYFSFLRFLLFITRATRVVLFSAVSVCVPVCLSVNTVTPEPLEISSRNFQRNFLWSKGRTGSKMATVDWSARVVI